MAYFLSDKNLQTDQSFAVEGEEARHILLSHRVKKGERIKLQGPNNKRFLCEVTDARKDRLAVKVLQAVFVPAEPSLKLSLFQAKISENALDFILQKSTELGVSRIVLFNSANVATKLSKDQYDGKSERWNKILWEAAKQCERIGPPGLEFVSDMDGV